MVRVIRARYENGVLKPLEKLDFKEGEELTIVVKDKSFYELARRIQVEAKEDVDKVLEEVRGRGKNIYG
ncbi:MAG: hypothetical protein DRN03_06380 [Thermoplasmata archaeon]|nr:MAG: hypothetical protein DRN03_06380 [Thermoplasmata archaeon]